MAKKDQWSKLKCPTRRKKRALSLLNRDVLVAKTVPDPQASVRKRGEGTWVEALMLLSQLIPHKFPFPAIGP